MEVLTTSLSAIRAAGKEAIPGGWEARLTMTIGWLRDYSLPVQGRAGIQPSLCRFLRRKAIVGRRAKAGERLREAAEEMEPKNGREGRKEDEKKE